MKKCATKECQHAAKFAVRICVPATGWAADQHEPLSAILGIEICPSCFDDIKPDMFFGPELDKLDNNMRGMFSFIAKGKCSPDFDRAFVERVSLASAEYAKYKQMIEKNAGSIH